MNHGFKTKYDQLLANDPTMRENSAGQTQKAQDEFYPSEGHVRNICFIPLTGKLFTLNYAYLVKMEYSVEENRIDLTWTTDLVALTGINLKPLFFDLFHQLPKFIVCRDVRYNATAEQGIPIVNAILNYPNA